MKQRPRRYFTDSEMAFVWARWRKGQSLNAIARELDRKHSTIQGALARSGHLGCRLLPYFEHHLSVRYLGLEMPR